MAEKNNIQVSFGISGMERQSFQHLIDEKVFTFARNSNIETDTESISLTNEHSNLLCSRFRPGYVVIGVKYDNLYSRIWFFLTEKHPDSEGKRKSEIGFIQINNNITDESDLETDCGCDMTSILSESLENTEPIAYCTYTRLIGDDCNNCLNFDPNHPVNNIILKQEACGYTMSFASRNNPPRYIIVDKIDYYTYKGDINCGQDNRENTCIDCDKLRIFPLYEQPYIYPEVINYGGNLRRGVYEFYIAYCDKLGNELTSYLSATNPVDIFDPDNINLEQKTQFDTTNYAIRLKVENLDERFNFYKVAVIEKTDVTETTSAFEEGIHSTVDTSITYSSNGSERDRRISLNRLFIDKPVYKFFGGMTTSNGILFGYDYEVEKEWNLQPIVSLMGTFVKWQTVESTEDLYKDGINNSLYKGYMRDETYPLGIKFITNTGYKTSLFPFMGRPATSSDLVEYDNDFNKDIRSVLENSAECSRSERNKKWQFYNTAQVLGNSFSDIEYEEGKIIKKPVEDACILEDVKTYNNIDVEIELDTEFDNLESWISDNKEDICTVGSTYYNLELCEIITDNITTQCDIENSIPYPLCDDCEDCDAKYCDPESELFDEEKCTIITKACEDGEANGVCSDIAITGTEINISSIENETVELLEKAHPWEDTTIPKYEHFIPKSKCILDNYKNPVRTTADLFNNNNEVVATIDLTIWGNTSLNDIPSVSDNNTCASAAQLPAYSQFTSSEITGCIGIADMPLSCDTPAQSVVVFRGTQNIQSYKDLPSDYTWSKDNLLTDITAPDVVGFENKITTSALWYEISFEKEDEVLFEITPLSTGRCTSDSTTGDGITRYTIFDKCRNSTILDWGTYNAHEGKFLRLKKSELGNRKKILIALDHKIITEDSYHADIQKRDGCSYLRHYVDKFYMTATTCGCFDVLIRDKEYYKALIKADGISVTKTTFFTTDCKFNAPLNENCGVIPHKYGMFSYNESSEIYPDNTDLYDSSDVKLKLSNLNNENKVLLELFEDTFVESFDEYGNIIWKQNQGKSAVDFRCEPIRHFKFPDNAVVPFMGTDTLFDFNKSKIYPIGITIDENTINVFLDAAVESGLIDQAQRDSIVGYELYRGDRTVNKSIVYKGIANDMYEDPYQISNNQRTFFRNFPYNTLGKNAFISKDEERKELIDHPFPNSDQNNRFSVIAPEVYYNRPSPPSEMVVEGYMYGKAMSNFVDVDDHSEWVILGKKAYSLADKLAKAEVVLEAALNIATLSLQGTQNNWFMFGVSSGGNPIGSALSIAAIAIYQSVQMVNLMTVRLPKLKSQWLEIFEQRGSVYNFAKMQVSSKGYYNIFKPLTTMGHKLRGLNTAKYLSNGLEAITEVDREVIGGTVKETANVTIINNKDRENSLYVYTGSYPIEYPPEYIQYDNYSTSPGNASRYLSSNTGCEDQINSVKRIASPYFTLKNYVPDQYGKIDEVKWLSLNHNGLLNGESKNIFGGDIYISRVDLKNKMKFFNKNAVTLANRTPFKYSRASNVGYTRFYVDHKSADEETGLVNEMPFLSSKYNLDCKRNGNKFYESDPAKFYLFSYGMPYFLVESEINNNYRYAGKEYHEQFASRGLNVEDWVQEKNVSIAYNNMFFYNSVYSRNQTGLFYRTLPAYYDREKWDCLSEAENGVAWSEQDVSEVSLSDPWLVFKPFNIYRFPFSYGRLISMNAIESTQVMGRFSDNMTVFNAVDVLKDRITPENETLGTGGIFATRPVQFSYTELGETGSQSKSMVSCEFGHFWVDAKRGKVFQLQPNAKGLNVISDFKSKGDESGMRKWFKRHLPFKILKTGVNNLTEFDIDNPYKGIGILMWWDSRFKRVFITKKDYIPKKKCIEYDGGNFYYNLTKCENAPQEITCPTGYEYNSETEMCEKITNTNFCSPNSTYNPLTGKCKKILSSNPEAVTTTTEIKKCEEGYTLSQDGTVCEKIVLSEPCPTGYIFNGTICEKTSICPVEIVFNRSFSNFHTETSINNDRVRLLNILNSLKPRLDSGVLKVAIVNHVDYLTLGETALTSNYTTLVNFVNTGDTIKSNSVDYGYYMCRASSILKDQGQPNAKKIISVIFNRMNQTTCAMSQCVYDCNGDSVVIKGSNKPSGILNMKDYFAGENPGGKVKMFIPEGDLNPDYNEIVDSYIQGNSKNNSNFPLPKTGTGINALDAFTIFDSFIGSIEDEMVENCTEQVAPICNCIIQNGLCKCILTETPSVEIQTSTSYVCQSGYSYNALTNTCTKIFEYEPCNGCLKLENDCECKEELEPVRKDLLIEIELTDSEYFKDVSWTIAYSPIYQSWISYYDFKPDYAIGLNDYFQTGKNYSGDEKEIGIWSHLLTNKSYQVFYGSYYPWQVSLPIKNTYTNNVLHDLKIWTVSKRYHDNFDYAVWRKKSFNKIVIHNQTNNSGLLHLNYDDSMNKSKYPLKISDTEQGIQATHYDNKISLNYFYNRVKKTDNHIPIWNSDENEIQRTLNPNAISFGSKKILERMRGDWFIVDLILDHSSQFKTHFKWMVSKEQGY